MQNLGGSEDEDSEDEDDEEGDEEDEDLDEEEWMERAIAKGGRLGASACEEIGVGWGASVVGWAIV